MSYEPENTSDTEEPDVDTMKKTFNRLAVQEPTRPPDNNHGPSRAQQEAEQRRL